MNTWNPKANEIFLQALELPTAGERERFLDGVCQGDTALRGDVEALLAAGEQAGSFLESPAVGPQLSPTIEQPTIERPGTVIGPYKLLEQIGEGGFGIVFMAEQTRPVRRKVALKVLKPGMDTRQVVARFEAERQALALMDHANIAKVLDAGATDSGRPYFVMDLVKGIPITEYCDQSQLTPRERLELFAQVCQAIQHAHQKGIIHRDIKPSNVLVTLHDGAALVKVIDFGIAKALGQQLTDKTLFTGFAQMIGTPLYMSPEQAALSNVDVDTRSDIYSLGVLLYELLTGTTPFEKERLKSAAFDEIRRIIREDEPPKPSTRLSDLGRSDQPNGRSPAGRPAPTTSLASIAALRKTEPRKLSQLVRGDLDWIVMKALEKDRSRRYETANGLAMDVHRYLTDEPVSACPPSTWYRLSKFTRRNKGPVLAAGLLAVALVGGVIGTTWGMLRATEAEGEAKRESAKKSEALAVATASEMRAKAAKKDAQENLKDGLAAVEQMLTSVAEGKLAYVPQMEPIRRELLLDALKFYQKFLEKQNDDPALRRQVMFAQFRVGRIHDRLGQLPEAERAYRDAFEMFDTLGSPDSIEPALLRDMVQWHIQFGWTLEQLGKSDEQAQHIRRAAELAEALDKDVRENRLCIFEARSYLADLLASQEPEEAEKILKENLALADDPANLEGAHGKLGHLFQITGRLPQAEASYRQAVKYAEQLAAENPAVDWVQGVLANEKRNVAAVIRESGRLAEAEELQRSALVVLEKLATDFPNGPRYRVRLADALYDEAGLLNELGRAADAQKTYRRTIELYETLAAEFPDGVLPACMGHCYRCLGFDAWNAGNTLEAEGLYGKAVAVFAKQSADHPDVPVYAHFLADCYRNVGQLLAIRKQFSEAEKAHRLSVEIHEQRLTRFPKQPFNLSEVTASYSDLADLLMNMGRPDEEAAAYRQAADVWGKLAEEFPDNSEYARGISQWLLALANVYIKQGRFEQVGEVLTACVEKWPNQAAAWMSRGELFAQWGLLPEAAADLTHAHALQEPADSVQFFVHALLRAYLGDAAGYCAACAGMLARFADSTKPDDWNNVAAALGVSADSGVEPSRAVAFAERAVAENRSVWRLAYLGLAYYRAGEFERAAAALEESLTSNANYNPTWVNSALAMARHQLGKPEEAAAALVIAGSAREERLAALLAGGLSHWPGGPWWDTVYAERLHKEAHTLVHGSPPRDDPRWIVLRGRGLATIGRAEAARAAFAEAFAIAPDELLLRVYTLPDIGRGDAYAQGLSELRLFLNEHPSQPPAARIALAARFLRWGVRQFMADEHEGAKNALAQAVALMPELGWLVAADDMTATMAICRKLADETVSDNEFRLKVGNALWGIADERSNGGDPHEAEQILSSALALFQKLAIDVPEVHHYTVEEGFIHWKLGWLMLSQNRLPQAEELFRKALAVYQRLVKKAPGELGYQLRLEQSHRELAGALARQGKQEEAAVEWDRAVIEGTKAIEMKPDHSESWVSRAFAHFHRGQWDAAVADFSKAIDLAPNTHTAWWHRGHAYLNLAQWDKAATDFATVVETWPDGGEGWYLRGVALANLDQPDKALADLRQAIAKGFRNLALMKADSRLDRLRNRDDFRELVQELETNLP